MPFSNLMRVPASLLFVNFLLASFIVVHPARAQDHYPSKPIRMVVAFAVGGSSDIVARLLSVKMADILGQQVLVDNRPGAGGNIGTDLVAKAPADGHTILLGSASAFAFNPGLYRNMPFDPIKDFIQVGQSGITNYAFVVHKDVAAKNIAELVAMVKAAPGKYTYGTPGIGTVPHLCTEEFKRMAGGLDITHVPYRGAGPVMNDLVAGQITMALDAVPTSIPQIQGGTIRAIANGSITRARALAEIPTVDEQGIKGFDCYVWFGLFTPAKTPPAIVAKLNSALNTALREPTIAKRLNEMNIEMLPHTTPETFKSYVEGEVAKWVPIGKSLGMKLD
ncbi:MAG: tripartite tricarboxylate transporter substrate binding protein [Acetobacteraceae bacterium]|nr:tripartite tricarboxylate transporter substrate binding protein [Acetobacteraceae bacterium]